MNKQEPLPAVPPGWTALPPAHLPQPSVWPVTLSLGSALLVWGMVASIIISGFGLVVVSAGLIGWVSDILYERKQTH